MLRRQGFRNLRTWRVLRRRHESAGNAVLFRQGPLTLVSPPARAQLRFMSTEDRIAKLEEQINDLHDQQTDLRKQLAQAQLDQWQGRIDDMEVQLQLWGKQASAQATALMGQLRGSWADSRRQFEESISTASSVSDTLRTGLERAYADLRKALLESRSQLKSGK